MTDEAGALTEAQAMETAREAAIKPEEQRRLAGVATLKRVINLFPEPGDVLELLREIIRLITDSLSVQN
jgi:hypothetical protein